MFERIIVGIDGREGGRDALRLADTIAGHDTDVELVHVHPYAEAMGLENAQAIELELEQGSRELLDEAAATVDRPVRTFAVGSSSPGFGLHTRAERTGADLVMIGNSRRSLPSRVFAGDTARAEPEQVGDLDVVAERFQRLLVLLEDRAGEQQPGGEQEQDHAGDPDELARRLERGRREGADHVQDQRDREGGRQPVVHAADQRARERRSGDVGDAGVRLRWGRVVDWAR